MDFGEDDFLSEGLVSTPIATAGAFFPPEEASSEEEKRSEGSEEEASSSSESTDQSEDSDMSGQPTVTVKAPKLGGTYKSGDKDVVWIGGQPKEDWSNTTLTRPKTPMCIRGITAGDDVKGYYRRVMEGNATKFKRDDEYTLIALASDALKHMETYGMDSVFYMKGSDVPGDGEELFTYHSKYTQTGVSDHVKDLRAQKLDEYGIDALEESGTWLVNSLDDTFKSSIRHELSSITSGPDVWMVIVSEILSDSLKRTSDLTEKFNGLKLASYNGENVREYASAAMEMLVQLEREDQLPKMHLLTIIDVFTECTVMDFKIEFMGRRKTVEKFLRDSAGKEAAVIAKMPDRITFRDLLAEGKTSYNNLQHKWGPAKSAKKDPVTAMMGKIDAMENKLNQALTSKGNGGGNTGGGAKSSDNGGAKKRKCWNCGSEDHLSTDPACPKYEKPADKGSDKKNDKEFLNWPAPAENQPKKKTVDGKTYYYCSKCGRGKGRWNDTHPEDKHENGWMKNNKKKSDESGNMAALSSDWHSDGF